MYAHRLVPHTAALVQGPRVLASRHVVVGMRERGSPAARPAEVRVDTPNAAVNIWKCDSRVIRKQRLLHQQVVSELRRYSVTILA